MFRRILRFFFEFVILALVVVASLVGYESIRLGWWSASGGAAGGELTPEQKAADMAHLLALIHQASPGEAVWADAGLDNPLDHADEWIVRARQAPDDQAFAGLVMQLLVHLGQGGHAYPAYDVVYDPVTSLMYNIPRAAFERMPYWSGLIGRLPWNAHASLDLAYQQGNYILRKTYGKGEASIPAGAVVEQVDGLPVDEFVLQQQYRAHLRFDPHLAKFYLYPLLTVDPGPDRPGWEVAFRLPDGSGQTVAVSKLPGYVAHRPDESRAPNVRCLDLGDDVLYIKISGFAWATAAQDRSELQDCFSSGRYAAAVLDVRGNTGGEIWSYMDNIIAPLAREPISYETTAALPDSFFAWHGSRYWVYRLANDNELLDARSHVDQVSTIEAAPWSEQGWRVLRVTRRIQPDPRPYPFDGQIYVLADNNTLSAGDSFAAVMQQTGMARVVGTNTAGWGQAAQAKMLYSLPNSGLIFFMDAELTLNQDGTLDNYRGVMTDVFLDPSTYPTAYPASFSLRDILADPWVQWVLHDRAD